MRIARWLALALLAGCGSAPPRAHSSIVQFSLGPAGVVRSDSWRGESSPQEKVSLTVELATVRIAEQGGSEQELSVTLATLEVHKDGVVLLDGRLVSERAESVSIEDLHAGSAPRTWPWSYETAQAIGRTTNNVLLAVCAFATFGTLVHFGGSPGVSSSAEPN